MEKEEHAIEIGTSMEDYEQIYKSLPTIDIDEARQKYGYETDYHKEEHCLFIWPDEEIRCTCMDVLPYDSIAEKEFAMYMMVFLSTSVFQVYRPTDCVLDPLLICMSDSCCLEIWLDKYGPWNDDYSLEAEDWDVTFKCSDRIALQNDLESAFSGYLKRKVKTGIDDSRGYPKLNISF
ncbi:MAG: hypothetical protein J1E00_02165 [Oscillospiraceae bacterium]|nr:hypothetical protein [Oscillospiraceae bacterium]